ncbi:hypothetical protein MKZ38_001627 [Zalerion maritima]|uniref:Alcohol dehydrogenase iron-type/glycerol dehydrogenase GldA domain-containing protein n=1 Tax=Zalerion maritima TaxID=339359 RepID=A0AAD5RRK2_9PEZI|nr:hypothetical protein MKZ38_001627 [Zalerion maritima]
MAASIRRKLPKTSVLYVFDVHEPACERFKKEFGDMGQIEIEECPRQIACKADVVVSMVPGAREVAHVYLDADDGIISATENPQRLLLECSTIDSETARDVAGKMQEAGRGLYVDAPVSGGVPAAEKGTLSFMMGHKVPAAGDLAGERLRLIVAMMGDPTKLFWCGGVGTGLAAKISNNYISCSVLLLVAEAMAVGVKSGVDPKMLQNIIHSSTGQTFMGDNVCPVPGVVAHAPSSNGWKLGFKTQMFLKDLSLGIEASRKMNLEPTMAEAAYGVFEKAAEDPRCVELLKLGSPVGPSSTTADPMVDAGFLIWMWSAGWGNEQNPFEYVSTSYRVTFGKGILSQLPSLVEKLGCKAVLVLSTPEQTGIAERVTSILGATAVSTFTQAAMHTPTHVTEKALSQAKASGVDGIVSVGGGSTIGLGKALSVRTALPNLCIPTTYAGSEMTPILGETENGRKTTRRSPDILPAAVLYDVDLTMTLPVKMSVNSGINAIAHGVEALYASNGNPIIDLMACEGIKSLCEALPALQLDSGDDDARYKALYGAWLCGMCLGAVDMALHHKLCHTLGGSLNLPHAETHVSVLPHAVAYNAPSAPLAMAKLAAALPDGDGDPVRGINALYRRLGIDPSLKSLGMPEDGIDKAADIAVSNPYKNPRPLERGALRELVRRAWAGEQASRDL